MSTEIASHPEAPSPGGEGQGSSSRPRRLLRPLGLLVAGCGVAAALALVLFVGVGTGSHQPLSSDVAPGINGSAASLLDLNLLNGSNAIAGRDFTLTDQYGGQVSLGGFRGKVVVLSFNDDQCTDLCTLLAQDIVVADRDLGPIASHVVFLSVSANPFYPSVASVAAWTEEHGLGGEKNWVFATGSPAQLRAIWKDYGAYVQLDYQNRTVVHSTELYFIDPSGQERAIASFGTNAANTSLYAHGMAQMAADLLTGSPRQGAVGGPSTASPSQSDSAVGAQAPVFSLPLLGQSRSELSLTNLRGRYVVLNFWASTCTACESEMPHIEQAYRDLGSKVAFVGIDVADNSGAAASFAKQVGVAYPLVSDDSGSVAGAYQISGLPFTIILGPSGKLLIRHPGSVTTEQLEYILENYQPSLAAGG